MSKMTSFSALAAAALFVAPALAGAQAPSPSPSPSPAPTQAPAPSTAEPRADKAMSAKGELVKVDAKGQPLQP